jgi:hypothetical protein
LDFSASDANARDEPVDDVKSNGTSKPSRADREHAGLSGFAIALVVILAPFVANADSGVVRTREARGPFIVSIFTPSEISRDLPTDVTVMVQRRDTGEIVMDAVVELNFMPPAGANLSPNDVLCGPASTMPTAAPARRASIRATRAQADNKLFYGATVVLRAVGEWQLRATVRQAREQASVTCALLVGIPARELRRLWPCLALPPVVVALFALNQWLRRQTANPAPVWHGRGI